MNALVSVGEFTPYDTSEFDTTGFDSTALSAPNASLHSITSHNNLYVTVGDEIIVSKDGYTWDTQWSFQSKLSQQFNSVAYVTSTYL